LVSANGPSWTTRPSAVWAMVRAAGVSASRAPSHAMPLARSSACNASCAAMTPGLIGSVSGRAHSASLE
jgi:hypothetical protein